MKLTLALAGLVLAAPPTAGAADPFSCRASAARTVAAGQATVEPVRANAQGAPCSNQSASVLERTSAGPVSADAVGAFTAFTGGAAALASASHPRVDLPGLSVSADAVQASAGASCSGSTPQLQAASRVVGLVINGQAVTVPPGDAPVTIPAGPAGSVILNGEARDPQSVTRRAITVVAPSTTVVLAEAVAGATPSTCAATSGDAAAPSSCPPGSTYDPNRNVCVIRESSGGGGGTTTVTAPYQGPTGGGVMTLVEARKKFKSPCLKGKGPRYVIVGTNKRDRVTGTNRWDRILLRGGKDKAEGGRGNDCIDGGKKGDTMSGALGHDRLYGKTGRDHLVGGSNNDRLIAGKHNDTINSGFGRDRVSGGKGRDHINIATAGPAAKRISCGKGRDKIRVNRNERRKAKRRKARCEVVYSIR